MIQGLDVLENAAAEVINEFTHEGYEDLPFWITNGLSPFELLQQNDPIMARQALADGIDALLSGVTSCDYSLLDSLSESTSLTEVIDSLETHGYESLAEEYLEKLDGYL